MKQATIILVIFFFSGMVGYTQQDVTIREYYETFKTYSFTDPDPVPNMIPLRKIGSIYPYFRFDGYTNVSQEKEWKVVEMENDYIKK